jgi:hypothetical protein
MDQGSASLDLSSFYGLAGAQAIIVNRMRPDAAYELCMDKWYVNSNKVMEGCRRTFLTRIFCYWSLAATYVKYHSLFARCGCEGTYMLSGMHGTRTNARVWFWIEVCPCCIRRTGLRAQGLAVYRKGGDGCVWMRA